MTTETAVVGNRTMDAEMVQPRRSLEELVDRLMDALFAANAETSGPSAARTIHEARRLRQAGDIDGGLKVLAGIDMTKAETNQARWAFSEWKHLVKGSFGGQGVMVYSQRIGRAAALVPNGDGTLEVVAVLGMRWRPGKVVSARSLRGLRPPVLDTGGGKALERRLALDHARGEARLDRSRPLHRIPALKA